MTPSTPLFQRLPEIYRTRDKEQSPPGQLEAFIGVLDGLNAALRYDIEALYHDFFIDSCNPWVIPYIADLIGTSHLSGDTHDLRADVARTVRNRRRKGTLGAIESVTFALSNWAVHAVEMRERLFWAQHLNHQRPDIGGPPPASKPSSIFTAKRGGTVTLRDPALLGLLGGPFDPFAHGIDLKPPQQGEPGFNLPNLAIFLWRLKSYQVTVSKPVFRTAIDLRPVSASSASFAVRFDLHPMGEPMVLFNRHRFRADADAPDLTHEDAVPGPMPTARLSQDNPAGRPDDYLRITTYAAPPPSALEAGEIGLELHLPEAPFAAAGWIKRGANLCAWEAGLRPALRSDEIVVDPVRGRVLFGVANAAEAQALQDKLLVSASYGFPGPVGAHPVSRGDAPEQWQSQAAELRRVNFHQDPAGLTKALGDLPTHNGPVIIQIDDSMTHDLDLDAIAAIGTENGKPVLRLASSLWIRAASAQRPVIRLRQPLAFRPDDISAATLARLDMLGVRLEGLYVTRGAGFAANAALIERAALNLLHISGCTLDPGGFDRLEGTRAPLCRGMALTNDFGFAGPTDFNQTPEIRVEQSITGGLAIDSNYSLTLSSSILDAGNGAGASPGPLCLAAATGDPEIEWGPDLTVDGLTAFGRMRVLRASGQGGIWTRRLEVHDNQSGCIRFSYFSGDSDRLPPHFGCVFGPSIQLRFTSESFGASGYARLTSCSDAQVRDGGPEADEMGAFGMLRNTHKWKNINTRLREYMPIGVRAVLIPVT